MAKAAIDTDSTQEEGALSMPVFEVRLEAPDSDEFRVTRMQAPDQDSARAWCEEREAKITAFQLEPADLKQADKAHRLAHEQSEPYEIVSIKKVA